MSEIGSALTELLRVPTITTASSLNSIYGNAVLLGNIVFVNITFLTNPDSIVVGGMGICGILLDGQILTLGNSFSIAKCNDGSSAFVESRTEGIYVHSSSQLKPNSWYSLTISTKVTNAK